MTFPAPRTIAMTGSSKSADDCWVMASSSRRAQRARVLEELDDRNGRLLGAAARRIDAQLRGLGHLVGRVDAREVLELATARLSIQALRVARLRDCKRRVDEDFVELARLESLACHQPLGTERRYEGD